MRILTVIASVALSNAEKAKCRSSLMRRADAQLNTVWMCRIRHTFIHSIDVPLITLIHKSVLNVLADVIYAWFLVSLHFTYIVMIEHMSPGLGRKINLSNCFEIIWLLLERNFIACSWVSFTKASQQIASEIFLWP